LVEGHRRGTGSKRGISGLGREGLLFLREDAEHGVLNAFDFLNGGDGVGEQDGSGVGEEGGDEGFIGEDEGLLALSQVVPGRALMMLRREVAREAREDM